MKYGRKTHLPQRRGDAEDAKIGVHCIPHHGGCALTMRMVRSEHRAWHTKAIGAQCAPYGVEYIHRRDAEVAEQLRHSFLRASASLRQSGFGG